MNEACNVEGCKHPSRLLGDNPDTPEGLCECHSWNMTYPQMWGSTACHRDFPQDFPQREPWLAINGRRIPVPNPPQHLTPCAKCGRLLRDAGSYEICGGCLGSVGPTAEKGSSQVSAPARTSVSGDDT